jgi:hypothetical protein
LPHSLQRRFSFTTFSVVFDVCFAIFPQTRKNRRIFTAVYNKTGPSHGRAFFHPSSFQLHPFDFAQDKPLYLGYDPNTRSIKAYSLRWSSALRAVSSSVAPMKSM